MRADNYLDHINDDDLDGNERFRSGGNWSVELVAPKALLDLLPEWESKNWWEVGVVIDEDGEGDACDYNDGIGVNEVNDVNYKLIKMVDVFGREQQEHNKGVILFYIYDNGKFEKRVRH